MDRIMKNIKNQYNKEALATYKRLAEIGFKIEYVCRGDAVCKPFRLGVIGPNGMVRIHLRTKGVFFGDRTVVKTFLAEMFTLCDGFFTATSENNSEVVLTFGVNDVVENFDEKQAKKADAGFYTEQEVEAIQ